MGAGRERGVAADSLRRRARQPSARAAGVDPNGYGSDPDLSKNYRPGEPWPLTLTAEQRRLSGIVSDLIIPADDRSPSASAMGVVDFIDEWVSAPYPTFSATEPSCSAASSGWTRRRSGGSARLSPASMRRTACHLRRHLR